MIAYLLEYNRYMSLIGIATFIGIAYLLSSNRRAVNIRLIFSALFLQILTAICMLKTSVGQRFVGTLAAGVSNTYKRRNPYQRHVTIIFEQISNHAITF